MPDFGVTGFRMQEDESADGGVRTHGTGIGKGNAGFTGKEAEDVPFQAMVGAGGITGGRFGAPGAGFLLQVMVDPS